MKSLPIILLLILWQQSHAAAKPFFTYDFEPKQASDERPSVWGVGENVVWMKEAGNAYLRIDHVSQTVMTTSYGRVALAKQRPADANAIETVFSVRYKGIKSGEKSWHDGRIIMHFLDKDFKRIGSAKHPNMRGTSKGWVKKKQISLIPEGAVYIEIMPTLFNAAAGQLDFDNVQLSYVHYKKPEPTLAQTMKAVVAGGKPHPSELHVEGALVKNKAGEELWLQGLAVPSLEWNPRGDYSLNTVVHGIEEWKANIIRLAVKDTFWFGLKDADDGGKAYRALIDQLVEACASRGVYIIIDLHTYKAPSDKTIAFWKDCAARYKNHPAVLFGLLNEPHSISWDVWKNGGTVKEKVKAKDGVLAENNQQFKTFESPGMQKVLDEVRATGAKNICVIGGLDWAYDLSGILKGFQIDDPTGNGVIYDSHVYPWKSDWQGKFLDLVGTYPILLGENGATVERMSFIPKERHEAPETWVPDMLGCIQQHKLHWTAWSFHPRASPCVLQDWNYTPSAHWGVHVKAALSGKQYAMTRKR